LFVDGDDRVRRDARRRIEAAFAIDRDAPLRAEVARARPGDAGLLANDRGDGGFERLILSYQGTTPLIDAG
jgi:hypothetical protein